MNEIEIVTAEFKPLSEGHTRKIFVVSGWDYFTVDHGRIDEEAHDDHIRCDKENVIY